MTDEEIDRLLRSNARMSKELEALSAENATLRAENAALRKENALLVKRVDELSAKCDALMELAANQNQRISELTDLLRRRPPRSPLRSKGNEEDPPPTGGTAPSGVGAPTPSPTPRPSGKSKQRSGRGRRTVSQSLPATEEHHGVSQCVHCKGQNMLARDTEVSEKNDIVRAHVRRRRIVREVKCCADCGRTTSAEMPPMPCKQAGYTCAFIAWLVVQKFVLLTPLNRVQQLLATQGVDIPKSTMVSLIERASDMLSSIDGAHWKDLLHGKWLGFDATGLKVRLEGIPTTWLGYLDVFTRDHLTVYQFSLTKHGDDLADRLTNFKGTLVCDAENRNQVLKSHHPEAFCNAHPRRKFRDAERVQPVLAKEAGAFLERMYAVEREARARGLVGEALLEERQSRTRPIVKQFKAWLEVQAPKLLPSDKLGQVVRYYLRHFQELTRFVDDPTLPIDNNRSERAFQDHARLRLNALFAGSTEGAHRWAILLGIVETASRLGLDVYEYLVWALERRGTWEKRFGMSAQALTPAAYKQMLQERAGRTA